MAPPRQYRSRSPINHSQNSRTRSRSPNQHASGRSNIRSHNSSQRGRASHSTSARQGRAFNPQPNSGQCATSQQASSYTGEHVHEEDGDVGAISTNPQALMPKNFKRPLTCYFWASGGRCAKSDDECHYAHFMANNIAAAPIRPGFQGSGTERHSQATVQHTSRQNGSTGARAQAVVTARQQEVIELQQSLLARQQVLIAREQAITQNEQRLNELTTNLQECLRELFEDLNHVRYAASDAHQALNSNRIELLNIVHHPNRRRGHSNNAIHRAVSALNAAVDDLNELDPQREEVENLLIATESTLNEISGYTATQQVNGGQPAEGTEETNGGQHD